MERNTLRMPCLMLCVEKPGCTRTTRNLSRGKMPIGVATVVVKVTANVLPTVMEAGT